METSMHKETQVEIDDEFEPIELGSVSEETMGFGGQELESTNHSMP